MKIFALFLSMVLSAGCCAQMPPEHSSKEPAFKFRVEEAYYHTSPEPNVVAAGIVEKGKVRVGDKVVVRHDGEEDVVEVIALLGEDRKLEEAFEGQGAGLRLKVRSEEQYLHGTICRLSVHLRNKSCALPVATP